MASVIEQAGPGRLATAEGGGDASNRGVALVERGPCGRYFFETAALFAGGASRGRLPGSVPVGQRAAPQLSHIPWEEVDAAAPKLG
jgi:hypothetical protein